VAPSYGDGGVMGDNIGVAHDPSGADYRATSPRFAQGGKGHGSGRHYFAGARIAWSSITATPAKLLPFTTVTSSGMYISPIALK
jgi:hypothetical protein